MRVVDRRAVLVLAGLAAAWQSGVMAQSPSESLLAAARRGDVAAVRAALAAGAPVDARDSRRRTALLLATIGDHPAVAQALIAAGADVNAQDDQQDSPFLYAGAEGRYAILAQTLAAGADLKSVNRYGGTALIPAAHHGHVETVRLLVATDIDLNHVNRLGWTALLEAVILGDGSATYREIVRILLDAGADPNIADRDGVAPLGHAVKRGFRDIAAALRATGGR